MATKTIEKPATQTHVRQQPPYHVILLNDDEHSFEYVIKMATMLFAHTKERAERAAMEVHEKGRVILLTTSREHAEFKQEQVHAFGPDPLVARCKGSMSCDIEPAA